MNTMPAPALVALVDENKVMIEALAITMGERGCRVKAQDGNAQTAIALAQMYRPRVLVVGGNPTDLSFPLLANTIQQCSLTSRIIAMVTTPASERHSLMAQESVWAVVSLRDPLDSLIREIDHVLSLNVRPQIGAGIISPKPRRTGGILSRRELEVLELIAEDKTNAEIACALTISLGTVKRHISNIYTKLEVNSRVGAIRRGLAIGALQITPHYWPPTP